MITCAYFLLIIITFAFFLLSVTILNIIIIKIPKKKNFETNVTLKSKRVCTAKLENQIQIHFFSDSLYLNQIYGFFFPLN